MSTPTLTASPQTKVCGCCHQTLPIEAFSIKNKQTGLRQSKCKKCHKAYSDAHYQATKATRIPRAKERKHLVKADYRQRLAEFCQDKSCVKCGETLGLTFMRQPGYKGTPVHEAVREGLGESTFQEALAHSELWCETCVGAHFGEFLKPYQFVGNGLRRHEVEALLMTAEV